MRPVIASMASLRSVRDDVVRHRHPRYRNLDGSDHIRFALPDADGALHRYVITAEGAGPVTTYDTQYLDTISGVTGTAVSDGTWDTTGTQALPLSRVTMVTLARESEPDCAGIVKLPVISPLPSAFSLSGLAPLASSSRR